MSGESEIVERHKEDYLSLTHDHASKAPPSPKSIPECDSTSLWAVRDIIAEYFLILIKDMNYHEWRQFASACRLTYYAASKAFDLLDDFWRAHHLARHYFAQTNVVFYRFRALFV